jgi:hypothetical protein
LPIIKDVALLTLRHPFRRVSIPEICSAHTSSPARSAFPRANCRTFCQYAAEQGWVEKLAGDQFRLPQQGFGGRKLADLTNRTIVQIPERVEPPRSPAVPLPLVKSKRIVELGTAA